MFSRLPREIKLHIFSFLKDLNPLARVSNPERKVVEESYKVRIKQLYHSDIPNDVNVIPYYQKLQKERQRLIDYLTLKKITEDSKGREWWFRLGNNIDNQCQEDPLSISELLKSTCQKNPREAIDEIKNFYKDILNRLFQTGIKFFIDSELNQILLDNQSANEVVKCAIWLELVNVRVLEEKEGINKQKFLSGKMEIFSYVIDVVISARKDQKSFWVDYLKKPESKIAIEQAKGLLEVISSLCVVDAEELLKILLAKQPDIINCDLSTKYDSSLLHTAIKSVRPHLVEILVEAGANVNMTMGLDNSHIVSDFKPEQIVPPFHFTYFKILPEVFSEKNKKIIQFLLDKGADLNLEIVGRNDDTEDRLTLKEECEGLLSKQISFCEKGKVIQMTPQKEEELKLIVNYVPKNESKTNLRF